jgi:putative membrane protein (TIGR04086 family)
MKTGAKTVDNSKALWARVLKGTLLSLCFSLIFILLFAFCLKFTSISESLITPVNQVIKGLSIFLGVFLALKKHKSQGLVCGLIIGFAFTILAFLSFSTLAGHFVFDWSVITDIIFGAIIGGICGIISVNLKKQ